MRKFRLKLDHPYAKAGTIVWEYDSGEPTDANDIIDLRNDDAAFYIPRSKSPQWLEEVKEEVVFTKEQADAIKEHCRNVVFSYRSEEIPVQYAFDMDWLDAHTLKTEE